MEKIVDRTKNILLQPKVEWDIIQYEYSSPRELLMRYVLPLAGIAAAATFLGFWIFGINAGIAKVSGFDTGLILGINSLIIDIVTVVLGAYIIDSLAPSFDAEKNLEKSMQLVAYAYTPVMVGAFLNIYPPLSLLGSLIGLYGIPLLYWGLAPMKHVPESKRIVYLIVAIVILFLLNLVIGFLLNGLFGSPYQVPA